MLRQLSARILLLSVLSSGTAFAGRIELVSQADPVGPPKPVGVASSGTVSGDGRFVAFSSSSPNLVPGQRDSNNLDDVFLYDRTTGSALLVSRLHGSAATAGNWFSSGPRISVDGRWVAFCSGSDDLVAGQSRLFTSQVFLYDRVTSTTLLVSHAASSPTEGSNGDSCSYDLSADGRFVTFGSNSGDLISPTGPAGGGQIYVFDRDTGATTLISHAAGSPAQRANGVSDFFSTSADGRWIVYRSLSTDLVPGVTDGNGTYDLFLHDRGSGSTTLLSHAAGSPLVTANAGASIFWSISGDGAWISFTSPATNLVAGQADSNGTDDVFLQERATGTTTLISHADGSPTTTVNGTSRGRSISSDGRWITFSSNAAGLVSGVTDANGADDLFLFDRSTGTRTLISHAAGSSLVTASGETSWGGLSKDGNLVFVYSDATDLVLGGTDSNGEEDLFAWDRASGNVTLVSHADGAPLQAATAFSYPGGLSADGHFAIFTSAASDLVGPSDGNGGNDIFLHDFATGVNTAVSYSPAVASASAEGGSFLTSDGSLASSDGRWIVFISRAANLIPGQADNNQSGIPGQNSEDVFLYDRATRSTILVSRSTASPTTTGNNVSREAAISRDGRYVAFISAATDLVPGQTDPVASSEDVFVFDRVTGTTVLASRGNSPNETICGFSLCDKVQISGDGRYTAFQQDNVIRLFDRETGAVTWFYADPNITLLQLSDDGRYIAFTSNSPSLIPGQSDSNGGMDVFLYDRVTASKILVSRSAGSSTITGNGPVTSWPYISADGRFVSFLSQATNHVAGQVDTNGEADAFLFDRDAGTVTLASRSAASPLTAGNQRSYLGKVSKNGRFVLVLSDAADLVPGQQDASEPSTDLFLFDRLTGAMSLVSHRAGSLVATANHGVGTAISADGSRVAFWSSSTDLIDGLDDTNLTDDLFLYDRSSGSLELVTRIPSSPGTTASSFTRFPWISDDGQVVYFSSNASDLAVDDFNMAEDVFAFVPEDLDFYTLEPCRLFDSRRPEDGPALNSGFARVLEVNGACGIPATARAVAVNVAVVQTATFGYLTLYPGDGLPPGTSTINFGPGQTRANNAVARLAPSGNGTLAIRPMLSAGGSVHVIIDVSGYFE